MSPTALLSARLVIALLLGSFAALGQGGPTTNPAPEKEQLLSKTVPVDKGDRCIVCNTPLQANDKVYLIEGQRVGVMKAMEPEFLSNPWAYIQRLKPGGGLFGGEAAPRGAVSDVWMYLGIYVLLGLVFGALSAHRALDAGQRVVPWFFAGLFLNLFAYLALLVRGTTQESASRYGGVVKIPTTVEPVLCSACDALNHPSATKCSKCGEQLQPLMNSEVTSLRLRAN
jgi:hypothetical protein